VARGIFGMSAANHNTRELSMDHTLSSLSQTGDSADVWQTWHTADQAGATAHTITDRGRAIVLQCRCALITTLQTSHATNMPPTLLAALVRRSIIPLGHALAVARQSANHNDRALALALLAAEAPNEVQAQCYQEAVAVAVEDMVVEFRTQGAADSAHQQRAQALAALVGHVPDPFQSVLVRAALAHINAIVEQTYWRLEALQALIPRTPHTLLPALLDVIPTLTFISGLRYRRLLHTRCPYFLTHSSTLRSPLPISASVRTR
jgi:hypothetical protein